jgi:predicted TIM-barrel fold metal-dependent hydrolase
MSLSTKSSSTISENTVIDADVHLDSAVSLPEDLAPYVDEPHLSRLERHNQRPIKPSDGFDRSLGGKIDDNHDIEGPDQIQRILIDEFGVDYALFNPTSKLPGIPVSDFAVAMMRGYNDWMLDTYLDGYDDHYGLAGIAPQKPDKAAEEIDRLGDEDKIVGIYLRTSGPDKPLGDPSYDIIYEAAQNNNLAVGYHGGASDFPNDFNKQYQGVETFLSSHTLAHSWSQMLTLTSIIVQGVPEKFPELEFVFMEAGLGWAPYMMSRLNTEYKRRRSEAPLLEKTPEKYIREHCYFTQQPLGDFDNPDDLAKTIDIIGADSIIFSTDYPHWDFDHPSVLDEMFQSNYNSSEDIKKVLNKNASSVFNIPT